MIRPSFIGSKQLLILSFVFVVSCQARQCRENPQQEINQFSFDTSKTKKDLEFFTNLPHAFGSQRQADVGDYIVRRGSEQGFQVEKQNFSAETPNPELRGPGKLRLSKSGRNILWFDANKKAKPLVLIASHYDTKSIKDLSYVGANDSASSSVAIMGFLKTLNDLDNRCHYVGVWFDGEESVLHGWQDGERTYPIKMTDNTYGSRYFVNQLEKCGSHYCLKSTNKKILALILLDMIGSKNPKITMESNSTKLLNKLLRKSLDELGYRNMIGSAGDVQDDHIPFLQKGIPAVNLIDFENIQFWHTHNDDLQNLSVDSMLIFSKIAMDLSIKTCSYFNKLN